MPAKRNTPKASPSFIVEDNTLKIGDVAIPLEELRPFFRTSAANKRQHLELTDAEVLMKYPDEFQALQAKIDRLAKKGKAGVVKQLFNAPDDSRLRVLITITGGAHDGDYLWVF